SELCVPARALARCHFTTSQRRCSLTSAPQTSSSSSCSPTLAPLMFLISTFMSFPQSRIRSGAGAPVRSAAASPLRVGPSSGRRLRSSGTASGLDFHVDAGREVELHQRVEGLLRRLEDVEEPLVRADLELLARLLVHVRRTQHAVLVD